MSDLDWSERFPEMIPVRKAPSLVLHNGCGFSVYGSRDADEETGTYVKTYCFCFLIPLLAVTAYRVANAPNGGWYFIGRVPLSGFARAWNWFLLLAAVGIGGGFGWHSYVHSVEYIANHRLAEADSLVAGSQIAKAAPLYREVAMGGSSHAKEAGQRLQGLLDNPAVNNSLKDAAEVYRAVIEVQQRTGVRNGDLEERGLKLIEQHGEKDLPDALALVHALQVAAPDSPKLTARQQALLERGIALKPNDVALVSELALLYEAKNQLPNCEKILLPLKDRLDNSEGARILGMILARKGKIEDACAVLEPYTQKKLQQFRSAEQAYHNASQQLITRIEGGHAEGFPYSQFKSADKAGKRNILTQYAGQQWKTDPNLKQANESYQQARCVVPAALDLGILLLRRAQMRVGAAREDDLKKAEELFLALQNDEAAESSAYRLSLGQVYYWLGKPAEGRKKFDEALEAENRKPQLLAAIARLLREVGERSQARSLLEEAYNKEPKQEERFTVALTLSVLATELDDKITWLQRADSNDLQVKADLSKSRADKAIEEGKTADAEPHLRQAIDIYQQAPENAAVLNNTAQVLLTLYSVTGDRQLLTQAEKKFDKAVSLAPRNSILLANVADALLDAAVRDVIGPAIDLAALKKSGDRSLLSYLYDDGDGQRRVTERFCTHPATVKATTLLERLLILAPKNPRAYRQLLSLYRDQRNLDKLRDLAARLERGTLDLVDEESLAHDLYAGKRDEKYRKAWKAQLEADSKRLETAGKGHRGVTYAVAATDLLELKIGLAMFGEAADSNEIVKLAESAYQAAPSFATRGSLESALLFRASGNLARKDAAFAALAAQNRRTLPPTDLLAVLIERGGPLRSLALADADVQRAQELIRETHRKAPDQSNAWAWAMLRSDQSEADKLAKLLRTDTLDQLVRNLNAKLYPFSADKALCVSWMLRASGKDKEAAAIIEQCDARGVPMPRSP